MNWKARYKESYEAFQDVEYPAASSTYGYLKVKEYPDVTKHNGLRKFATDFLKWNGHHAEVTGNTGRKIFDKKKQKEIWINGSGTNGTSDVKCDIAVDFQRSPVPVKIEIKVGRDFQSDAQIEYEADVTTNGALYWLIRSPERLIDLYDNLLQGWDQYDAFILSLK